MGITFVAIFLVAATAWDCGAALGTVLDEPQSQGGPPYDSGLNHTALGCPENFACDCLTLWDDQGMHKVINCSTRAMEELPSFVVLTGLKFDRLLLNDNKIRSLFKNAFQGLEVESIDLSGNKIASVSDIAFVSVEGVKKLSFAKNKLDSAPVSLKYLSGLTELNLANNNIRQLSHASFQNLTSLEILDLSSNPVQFASPFNAAESLTSLRVLRLENCSIPNLPLEVLKHVSNLELLNVKRNNITSIPEGAFDDVPLLKEIDLEGNSIVVDDLEPFADLRYLKILKFSHCHMTNISADIMKAVVRLHTLVLRHCRIQNVFHGPFRNLYHLHKLDVSGNSGIKINDGLFHGLEDRLKSVGIENTNLTSFPTSAFRKLFLLKKIKANRNPIRELPRGVFRSLKRNHMEIHLDRCEIFNISLELLHETNVPLKLYLRDNKITSLDFVAERPCDFYSSELYLEGNPIECDCEAAAALQQKTLNISGTCSSPREFEGAHFAPPFQEAPGAGLTYLETLAPLSCSAEKFLNDTTQRYNCPCHTWVPVNSTMFCAGSPKTTGPGQATLAFVVGVVLSICKLM